MIRIEAVRAIVHTNTGLFGRTIELKKGLNIVRANNTHGKSSLFGAILYGLGFEEILGSKNEKALQSVFKSIVKEIVDGKEAESIVIQSEIYLQFGNGRESITTKRFIINDSIKPQAVEVFWGKVLTTEVEEVQRHSMYLHDKGAASNEEVGFHKFLEDFIGAKLPEIINQEGKRVKMFFPLVAAAHFIEQKAGWSDFFASMPYYGIRDAAAKVFEYVLGLDVFEIAAKRQEIQNRLKEITDKWVEAVGRSVALAKRGGGEVVGLPNAPQIMGKESRPYLRFLRGDKTILLSELITNLKSDLQGVAEEIRVPVVENIEKIETELENLRSQTDGYEIFYENFSSQVSQDKERHRQYLEQLKNVDEDLRKNKDANKLQSLGLDADLKTSTGVCPTCNQPITDTLLDEHLHAVPMRIDENISYLQAQRKMISAFIANLREQINLKENKVAAVESAIQANRQRIRALKKTLVSDDRLPSEEAIERKVILEREISFLFRLREEFEQLLSEVYQIGEEYESIKALSPSTSNTYLSPSDVNKVQDFENYFKILLNKFGFTSKPIGTVHISLEKYLPVYELPLPNGLTRQVDIRFESSGSDYIRAQWAYYTALMGASIKHQGNHFRLMMFDEPQQQSAGYENFRVFLEELEKFQNEQPIVFASFQNSQENYHTATQTLTNTNVIDLAVADEMFIMRQD